MEIKICGIRREEDIKIVNKYLPNYIGFIFVKKSKRYIEPLIVKKLVEKLDKRIKKVGVFVNESLESIEEIKNICKLDVIQLHGEESVEFCSKVEGEVWKALRVKDKESIKKECEVYYKYVDKILLDTYSSGNHGGTGVAFDWEIARELASKYSIILAGGINETNVVEAIEKVPAKIIDVASGSETNGIKDEVKIEKIIKNIRGIK